MLSTQGIVIVDNVPMAIMIKLPRGQKHQKEGEMEEEDVEIAK